MSKKDKRDFYAFSLVKENEEPSIEGRIYPNSYTIQSLDEVYDEKTDTNRVIRYAPGEKTIWFDEQNDQDLHRKRAKIQFMNGQLVVDKRQKLLLDFLRASNGNSRNPNRMPTSKVVYTELLPGEQSREFIKDGRKRHQAIQAVYDMKLDDLIAYARVLGVDVKRDPDDVRYHMTIIAEDGPEEFLSGMNSNNTKRKHYILKALDAGIINVAKGDNSVRWTHSKQAICQAPVGVDPIDHFVDFTFDSEGERVYELLRDKLSPKNVEYTEEEVEEGEADRTSSNQVDYLSMDASDILKEALDREFVIIKPVGKYMFQDKLIETGKKKVVKAIDENEVLKRALIVALEG